MDLDQVVPTTAQEMNEATVEAPAVTDKDGSIVYNEAFERTVDIGRDTETLMLDEPTETHLLTHPRDKSV